MSGAPVFGRLRDGSAAGIAGGETFTELLRENGVRVERILSRSAATPDGEWYDQDWTEFVLLVEGAAVLGFADGSERRMEAGDWAVLPAGCKHRVVWTGEETVWLAVHIARRWTPWRE